MSKKDNIEIYNHSMQMISEDDLLLRAVEYSIAGQTVMTYIQPFGPEDKPLSSTPATIRVSRDPSFGAAMKSPVGEHIAVLNFASWLYPGGGVEYGANAQEEALCRISTLHPCLLDEAMEMLFYGPHREVKTSLYNDDMIYTPNVIVFKSDTEEPKVLPSSKWRRLDVISMAAPNIAAMKPMFAQTVDLDALYRRRIGKIMKVAYRFGATTLVLGAFGCGVFGNDPYRVADAMADMTEKYGQYFKHIEIPVYCGPNPTGPTNYDAFAEVFADRFGKDVIDDGKTKTPPKKKERSMSHER